jgi:uncharacterized protein (TIGR02466 family)
MASQIIFSDTILYTELKNKELHNKILQLLNTEVLKNNNNIVSNSGGFQTHPIKDNYVLDTLATASGELINENYKFKKKTQIILQSAWINENKKNHYNKPHVHSGCNFSGVYFVRGSSNDGDLVFVRNDISGELTTNDQFIEDNFLPRWHIKPITNLLVLFPSNLLHLVEPHSEDISRISVAFNIKFKHG